MARKAIEVSETTAEPKTLALAVAEAAASKKAEDITLLDMRGLVDYTDFMVICNGRTPRQSKAVLEAVRFEMKHNHGISPRRVEGDREAEWILMDLLDCVLHVFTPDAREFYRLEHLWQDAPRETYSSEAAAAGS